MKARQKGTHSRETQYFADATLNGFQSGINHGIEDVMQRPIVISGDDQMSAGSEDAENLCQRRRQRNQPLGYANHQNQFKSSSRKRQTFDVAHLRKNS